MRSEAHALVVRPAGPGDAEVVWRITRDAFEEHRVRVEPPSGALRETVADVRSDLEGGAGALAWLGDRPVGAVRVSAQSDHLYVGRLAVQPGVRRRGVGRELMRWAEEHARQLGLPEVRLGVRVGLPEVLQFYLRLGYQVVGEGRHAGYDRPTYYRLAKRVVESSRADAAPRVSPDQHDRRRPPGQWPEDHRVRGPGP